VKKIAWTFLVSLLFLAQPGAVLAQFETASVLGTVRDASGAVLPGASVTLANTATGVALTRTTDDKGTYEFFTVRPGTYNVTAELAGFASATAPGVKVSIGARQRVDLVQSPGQVSETVEVTSEVSVLETDSSQRGQVITSEQAVALPLNGREYSSLVLLTTGVRFSALNTGGFTPREGSFNINGLRSTFNNFLLDGLDNNAYGTSNQGFSNQVMQPPPDAVAEFKVTTNNMSAEYGRTGGGTVNVAYRSGTNEFHATAWEFLRNDSLNATGFFKPVNGEKPPLSRNQFGAVVGGPIVKNKAFFFADYEGFRQTREFVTFSTIPDLASRQGLLPVTVRNPLTGKTYPAGTAIPSSDITPFAAKVLGALPAPTSAGRANNYEILQAFGNDIDKWGFKLDVQVSPQVNAFARYGWRDLKNDDDPPIPLPSGGGGNGQTYVRNRQLATGITWAPSSDQLLEFRFGWSKTTGGKNPLALGSTSAEEAYGITGLPTDPRVAGGLPSQLISGFSDLGRQATNPQWQYPTVFNPKINYTRSLGRHSLKAGLEFQHIETEVQDVNPLYGRDEYAGRFSRPAGETSTDNYYNLADFLFGLRSRYALTNFFVANLRQNLYFAYLQDDFKVRSNLTLNLGLRYEYGTPQWERDNVLSNFDPNTRTMVAAQDGSIEDRARVSPDRNNFAPRVGFAWELTPKTVLRGGYGINYIHFNRAGGGNVLPINGPQVINAVVSQANPLDAAFRTTQRGYPAGLTDPSRFDPKVANTTYMPNDYKTGRVQSWFASVQRELFHRVVVDLAYVGNRADNLLLFANYNQAVPNNAAGTASLASRRPIAEFGDITYAFDGGLSRYQSFQARVEARVSSLTLLSSFTLSKARDNGAGTLENPNGNFPAPQDFYNLAAEEGVSAYDQPWNSTTSIVWEIPVGRGRRFGGNLHGLGQAVLGGWRLSAINFMWAGEPVTLRYNPAASFQVSGITQDFRGANNYRPNVVGEVLLPADERSPQAWFDRNAVVIPTNPSQPFGNAPRNSVRGPSFYQLDLGLSKIFELSRQGRLELRLEAFNVLNKTNFRAPEGNRSLASFGTITGTYDPRQIQLGVKLSF
jgi:Carboxypeptidase regulatory-like domain/TonB-dependent Receptor Plug Domain/TonB dependent receptor